MQSLISLFKGVALALLSIGIAQLLPEDLVFPFFALLLTFAAGVYVGFAIVDRKHVREYAVQILGSLIFLVLALISIWKYPILLAVGWALHALWDLLHHLREFKTETGRTYPLMCLSYDLIVAWYLYYLWMLAP